MFKKANVTSAQDRMQQEVTSARARMVVMAMIVPESGDPSLGWDASPTPDESGDDCGISSLIGILLR